MTIIQYEEAQARLEDEMRRAAVWRMQRQAREAGRTTKRTEKNNKVAQGGWLMSIGKALGAGRNQGSNGTQADAESARNN